MHFIELRLHGKSPNTIRAYRPDIAAFRAGIGKPIRQVYLLDLQRYADTLEGSLASLGHTSLSTTGRYLYVRPEKSSGDYLALQGEFDPVLYRRPTPLWYIVHEESSK